MGNSRKSVLWNTAKMVKNLQCLKTPQIYCLKHAEHHAKQHNFLPSLDYDTLFRCILASL